MRLINGDYTLSFRDGGVEVRKKDHLLYFNQRPMFVTVKTESAVSEFYDQTYREVENVDGRITAKGTLIVPSGSEFSFQDSYEVAGAGFKISRKVIVEKAGKDLGFSTKFSLVMVEAEDPKAYHCFAPGVWYKQNEFARENDFGKDLDCEYFWRLETGSALPLFAMQNIASGEMAALSRFAPDITMRSLDILQSENNVDPKFTIGAIGMSKPKQETLNYLYYGFAVRKEIETKIDGLSIDYIYPGCNGQMPGNNHYGGLDFKNKVKIFERLNHPVEEGFTQNYSVAINFGHYDSFQTMMREIWRVTYQRLRDTLFEVDNKKHFHNCMRMLAKYTKQYGDSYGLPFACQLPDMDISSVSFQFGFVGQQPGIGYQLLRYGDKEKDSDIYEKGVNIIDFWVRTAMTESGLPQMCYNPNIKGFEPYPFYIRMLADG
jgi:hypothetical protein